MKNSNKIGYAFNANTTSWSEIDWTKANRTVKLLQRRIVKAWQEGKHRKAKSLQWILTHSYSAKVLAVRRVTENTGKRTAGIDNVIWRTPKNKWEAIQTLSSKSYKAKPLRRIYIPKSNGQKRPLSIPTMKDRAMQALYLMALDPISETQADVNSYGFRPKRSCADAIEQCFTVLGKNFSAQWVMEGDIKGCFDNINHDWILQNIPLKKRIVSQWLKAGIINKGQSLFSTEKGTPQGGIISPVLANMVLDNLEAELEKLAGVRYTRNGFRSNKRKVNLVRYADDFIVTCNDKSFLEEKVKPLIEQFLADRGLTLSKEKTKITHISEGFDFLGQNIRKYSNNKMLIKPSKCNYQALKRKIKTIIDKNKTAKTVTIIRLLNPVIRGWALYHRHIVAKKRFRELDKYIFQLLWRWAVRRHKNKGKRWVKRKYFKSIGTRNWVFSDYEGEKRLKLFLASDIPIIRHVRIRRGANPYDRKWEEYFESRTDKIMLTTLKGFGLLTKLWKSQNGICPICKEKITTQTKWHTHHLQPKHLGGKYIATNLIMLHPDCHRKVHSQRIEVVKPCYTPSV